MPGVPPARWPRRPAIPTEQAAHRLLPGDRAAVAQQIPAGSVVDGELVVYRSGRCDFAALQSRIRSRPTLAVPATFVVFDLLALAGRDLRGLPYRKRRKRLRQLLADATLPLALI